MEMYFLIIGLGSMGKRRVRNLQQIGYSNITGFDLSQDRRREAERLYGISTVEELSDISSYHAVIISTPPDLHSEYIQLSIVNHKPCFVELSLLLQDLPELNSLAQSESVLVAPSCTTIFHSSIRKIIELVESGMYGGITNFTYHCGHFLPDWHPWEDIKDFFATKRGTSGCKELLGFELPWIVQIAGRPEGILNVRSRAIDFDADIDITFSVILKYATFSGVMHIDIASRFPTRTFILNLEKAQIRWSIEDRAVKLYDARNKGWQIFAENQNSMMLVPFPYNWENTYIREIKAFIDAVNGLKLFPNTLSQDIDILNLIKTIDDAHS